MNKGKANAAMGWSIQGKGANKNDELLVKHTLTKYRYPRKQAKGSETV